MSALVTKQKKLKRIEMHSDEELNAAVDEAVGHCSSRGLDFWKILHGVDAYVTRRKRRDERRDERERVRTLNEIYSLDSWGDS